MGPLDPVKCEKCGNEDQHTLRAEPSHVPSAHGEPKSRAAYLVGHRCEKCGHVTKLQASR
jgi:uncharacterized Zn finger protein